MKFVGLDLAWSTRNLSGAVVLGWDGRGAWVEAEAWLGPDEEIVAFVEQRVGPSPALVAVDAPLVVPNVQGSRPCDRELSRHYRAQRAGAYPANREKFGGRVRGEELVRQLARLGFALSPRVGRQEAVRQVVEVYPHPATIELFGLPRILPYKARPDRSYEQRWAALRQLREHLAQLAQAEPSLEARRWLRKHDPFGLRGRRLKRVEDLFDALLCAYIGLHMWYWGPRGYRLFGDAEHGHILVPVRPSPG